MSIVIDSNVLIVLASGDPRKPAAQMRVRAWMAAGEELHAPELLPYEVANALTRLVVAGTLPPSRLTDAWRVAFSLPIAYHSLRRYGDQVVALALRLGRQSAYDAAYLALAQQLQAELWTFDGPLARNAASLGFPVRLIQ